MGSWVLWVRVLGSGSYLEPIGFCLHRKEPFNGCASCIAPWLRDASAGARAWEGLCWARREGEPTIAALVYGFAVVDARCEVLGVAYSSETCF